MIYTQQQHGIAVLPAADEEDTTRGASLLSFFLLCHLPTGGNNMLMRWKIVCSLVQYQPHIQTLIVQYRLG